jgi:transcriptional regulator with XRE-family HTH domain
MYVCNKNVAYLQRMRVYLQSRPLGAALKEALKKLGKTQVLAASELSISQGQLSHVLSGDFKTKNGVVTKVCKYVNVDADSFATPTEASGELDREALAALSRACGGHKHKTVAVIRVLRALE